MGLEIGEGGARLPKQTPLSLPPNKPPGTGFYFAGNMDRRGVASTQSTTRSVSSFTSFSLFT